MSTSVFHRPPRRGGPPDPGGEIVLESPPALTDTGGAAGPGQWLTYLPMLAGAGATGLLVSGSGGQPITYLASGMMALSMVGMAVNTAGRGAGEKRVRLDGERRGYQRHLEQVRRRVRASAEQQRAAAQWRHPDPDTLVGIAAGTRTWERRPGDDDFLAVRIGRGPQRLAVPLTPPQGKPVEELEPVSAAALRRFVTTHAAVDDLPVALGLAAVRRLCVQGSERSRRRFARAVIAQLVAFHSPDDLVIAVCADAVADGEWEWLKWLPHALSRTAHDGAGPLRLAGNDLTEVAELLGDTRTDGPGPGSGGGSVGPHAVVIVDGDRTPPAGQLGESLLAGVTLLELSGAPTVDGGGGVLRLRLADRDRGEPPTVLDVEHHSVLAVADGLSMIEAETLARQLAPLRLSTSSGQTTDALAAEPSLPTLLGLGDPRTLDPADSWRARASHHRLRVPIGIGSDGRPIELDLTESAQGGIGPHGLVIGATGSGKSELLRTLVTGLALTHSSETLNFVLVDFKGGATFATLDALPHTSAVITNLENELVLVDRMRDAIQGELVRRQQTLRAAGNFASVHDYERAREQGADLEAMPSLMIVVDEFSELLAAKPDFIDLFVMIGRLGRSLGVHLLLASQRLEEGRLRGLDTQLSYRIGLRTFSSSESRVVLGVPDAYELPAAPGHGYLRDASEGLVRFKAAYVSGPHVAASAPGPKRADEAPVQVLPYRLGYVAAGQQVAKRTGARHAAPSAATDTLLELVVGRLAGAGTAARQIWLPPLQTPPTLDHLLPSTDLGPGPDGRSAIATLTVPIGLIDRPFEQRRDQHLVELAAAHFVVVGRPQSGKSTVLRTLVGALSLTHTPAQVQFYCLDFGGGTLGGLADLPHVGSVATRRAPELLRRTVADITALLAAREQLFAEHGIDSMATYRRQVVQGAVPQDGFGDVFLVVDGWGAVRAEHEQLETAITQIAARGLGYGVHVILSVQRWMELRPGLRDLISSRLELRLGDPAESEFDRRVAAAVPESSPGRGLGPAKLHHLCALPRIDGVAGADDLTDGVADLVTRVRRSWSGPGAPPVRLLPSQLPYDALPAVASTGAQLPIGVDEDTLAPVYVDFDAEPHLLVVGDVESGKSNLLRSLAWGITSRWTHEEAKVVTVDYRRSLRGAIDSAHQIGYVPNPAGAKDAADSIVAALRRRLADVRLGAGAAESATWTGPRLFVIMDDYDLISSGRDSPLQGLLDFLPQARDIGLHLILSRSSGGAGQGMFEPVTRTLRDLGTPGVLLSGSKDEGAILASTRMEPLPPGRGRLVHRRLGPRLIQTALT